MNERTPATALDLLQEIAGVLDRADIAWVVGGSVASSILGEPRGTIDLDVAVRLDSAGLNRFLAELDHRFYVPEASAAEAVEHGGSFNIVDPSTALKVDLFVLGSSFLDRRQLERRLRVSMPSGVDVWVTDAADQVLRKLDWYRKGGEVSDRQWRDVVGLLRSQEESIDRSDLGDAARQLGLGDLLHDAIAEADGLG